MDKKITGIMFYYYFVCKRKLWYFTNDITMEQNNIDVQIGKLIDENSYSRENKHININGTINIDFLKNTNVLHEVKKSRSVEEASIWQVKYYLYYLQKKECNIEKAIIDYPLLRKNINVFLEHNDIEKIEKIVEEIKYIINNEIPNLSKKSICTKCAYFDLCFI